MNILVTCPTFFPRKGGAEVSLDDLTRTLVAQGHALTVVTSRLSPHAPEREVRSGVEIHRLDYPPQRLGLATCLSIVVRGVGLLWALRGIVKRRRVEVVCIGLVGIEAFAVLLLKRLTGFRLVVYLHGGELRSYIKVSPFMRRTLAACLRACDAAIAVSAALRDEAIAFEPRVRRKVHVIPNGIDMSAFTAAAPYHHPRPYALYVGRLHPVKGVDTLIRAFGHVASRVADLDLLIVGAGPEETRLRALAADGNLGARLVFLGERERSEVLALLRGSEFLVLPSRAEGFPVVVLETMAAGRMTIGSRVRGIADAVQPGITGALFEPGNDRELADLMCAYHADAGARQAAGANAARASAAYDIRQLAGRHVALYGGGRERLAVGVISLFYYRDPACAGLSSYYFNLAKSLSDLGHDVYTITTETRDAPRAGHLVTVPVARERLLDRAGGAGVAAGVARVAARLRFAWTAYREVRRLDRLHALDVIIAPELWAQGLFAALFMARKLITRIHTPTSIGDRYNDRPRPLVTRVLTLPEWLQARRSRAVSVASTHLATVIENEWRIPPARTHVIPNSVQIDWVRRLAETPGTLMPKEYLLYFGRLERRKGVHVLSEALHQVFARRSDVTMVFIGSDGGLRKTLVAAHRERTDRVRLFEAMDKGPLFAAIRGARLVVLPSLFENMSNAGLEAMALARPVVGTSGTAFEEIIEDGVNGFLTPPGDAAALAAKILSCLERTDLEEIGRRGFETVRRFDAHAVAPLYAELCREVASGDNS